MKYFNTLAIVVSLLGLLGCASDLTADNTIFAADAGWSGDSGNIAQKIDGADITNHDSGRIRRYKEDIAIQAEAVQQDSYDADVAPDVAQEEVSVPQCATNCDDNNPCTTDTCYLGECQYAPVPNNCGPNNTSPCDDGNACSSLDCCQDGECKGVLNACDDYNPCTTDSCDKSSGECLHMPVQDGTTCNDQDGCTVMDICKNGVCTGTVPMYGVESKNPDKGTFTCVPCQEDADCEFKSKTFCVSSYGPGGNYSNPVPVLKPTGKCVANACEFKKDFCNDGDYTTIDSCSSPLGSPYPLYKAGECKHQKLTGENVFDFYISECWCKDQNTLECVKATFKEGQFTVQSDTTKICPNGCGWDCL